MCQHILSGIVWEVFLATTDKGELNKFANVINFKDYLVICFSWYVSPRLPKVKHFTME